MALATFKAALSIASCGGDMLTIGGGEPTLHKSCLEFVWLAVRSTLQISEDMGHAVVGLVTNGSVKKAALEIAHMAKVGLISARLSYDSYHDTSMVDESVLRAFKLRKVVDVGYGIQRQDERDLRSINNWSYFITPHGRALDNGISNHPYTKETDCCCDGLFISPDGTIWQCGCREHKLGHTSDLKAFWFAYNEALNGEDELPCSKKQN
jgi:hypothetical protein